MSEPTEPRSSTGSRKASQDPSAAAPGSAGQQGADPPATDPHRVDPQASDPHGVDPQATGAVPAATQPLPATGAVPGFAEAVPAAHPTTGVPSGPAGGPPSGPPPVFPPGPRGPGAGGPVGPPPKRPGLWRQATSTTGGLVAVIVAGALCALLVLGVVGTIGLVALRAAGHDRSDQVERVREDGRQGLPPGQRKLDRLPQGPDRKRGQGNGNGLPGQGNDDGIPDPGDGMGPGNGMGGLMRGAMGLGDVQHGELTVQQDGKAVVLTLQRGAVTKASATSVSVRSDDGFTATYVLDQDTRGRTGALAVGDSVVVVAEKAGAKAVMVTGSRTG